MIEEFDQLTRSAGIVEVDEVRMKRDLEGRVMDKKIFLVATEHKLVTCQENFSKNP
ncbi:MAG: hypothetical protein OJF47_003870 [Nitrospira sp.]|nr:MAG: hypothetical protein OJF47_003870 [Nitrospira sp.]